MGDIAVRPANDDVLGVDSPEVKKLPEEIKTESEVNNNTYTYIDPVELLEGMKGLRRKFGWICNWIRTDKSFIFHMSAPDSSDLEDEAFAQFEIKVEAVYQKLWPSLYPNDPDIPKLRAWFFAKRGPNKVANWLNETLKDAPALPEEASAWSRLLSDDDLV